MQHPVHALALLHPPEVLNPKQILGTEAVFWLTGRRDITASAWLDQMAALSLTGHGTPTISPSGVVTFARASAQDYDTGALLADLIAGTTRPYAALIARQTTGTAQDGRLFGLFDAAFAVDNQLGVQTNSGSGTTQGRVEGASLDMIAAPQGRVTFFEVLLTAGGVREVWVNRVLIASSSTGVSTIAGVRRVIVGGITAINTTLGADCEIQDLVLCPVTPTDAKRDALRRYAQQRGVA